MRQDCEFYKYASEGERKVARKLVRRAINAGYTVSVWDGDEYTVKHATSETPVLEALATTGIDNIVMRDPFGRKIGTVALVWGNDPSGDELIADYTVSDEMERLVAHAIGE